MYTIKYSRTFDFETEDGNYQFVFKSAPNDDEIVFEFVGNGVAWKGYVKHCDLDSLISILTQLKDK
jgi:hypothetical protein